VFLSDKYNSLSGFDCPVECMNDAELAHYAVTGGQGLLVISGTGSIAFGTSVRGISARVGGWMLSIMGEEGSGSWVSRKALRHLGRYFDKVVPDSLLARMLREHLDVHTPKQLMDLSAHITSSVKEQCNLGSIVDNAANKGDEWAIGILQDAAEETMGLVRDLVSILRLDKEPHFKVGIWGSNIVKSKIHRDTFHKLLMETYPNAELCLPGCSAVEGATKLALERLNTQTAAC
jgi:N-acetylglucosamine kinase-like BadF-type ATPase